MYRVDSLGLSLALTLVLASSCVFAQDPASGSALVEPTALEQAAEQAFVQDDLERALTLYRELASATPLPADKTRALMTAATLELDLGRRESALRTIIEALVRDSSFTFRSDLYGEEFAKLFYEGQKKAVEERDKTIADLMRRGLADLREKRYADSKEKFRQVLELRADLPQAIYNLALTNFYLEDRDQALAGFQKIVALEATRPGSIPADLRSLALTNLGMLHIERSMLAEAEANLEEAIRIDPRSHPAWSNLGVVRRRLDKKLPAAEAFRRAHELAPEDPGSINNLALAYIDAQDWVSAVALLRPALDRGSERFTGNSSLWLNLGTAQMGLGNEVGALESFEKAIAADPSNSGGWAVAALQHMAKFLLNTRSFEACVRATERALELAPTTVNAWIFQGLARQNMNDLAGARASLEKARDLDPTQAEIHNNLGSVYFDLGQYEAAEQAFQLALAIRPDLADARTNLEAVRQARQRPNPPLPRSGPSRGEVGRTPTSPDRAPRAEPAVSDLGLRFSEIDYSSVGLKGAMVEAVQASSSAARAGIQANDLILKVDGRPVGSAKELRDLMAQRLSGQTLVIDLLRANRPTTLRLVIP